MQLAVTGYLVVQSVHVMAVVAAYGLPLAYPQLIPYLRRRHPRSMPGVHDVQYRLNVWLTGPGTAIILAAGVYMAGTRDLWGQTWVTVPVVIIVLIGAVGGAVIVPASRRMAALARADVEAAASGTASVSWSREYDRVYGRYMAAEIFLGLLVLIAIFFMVAKP
jgi:small-conductance mechanosensitive channel